MKRIKTNAVGITGAALLTVAAGVSHLTAQPESMELPNGNVTYSDVKKAYLSLLARAEKFNARGGDAAACQQILDDRKSLIDAIDKHGEPDARDWLLRIKGATRDWGPC